MDFILNYDILIKLILAALIGVVLGFEREIHGRPAGIRTHSLVCLGSALVTVVSISVIDDPARIAAGIITGIGFLGAGAIFKFEDHVAGLTTAANLWVTAAIGLAIGFGFFEAAITAFLLTGIILVLKSVSLKKK
ncbi:MAG: MgtC/SapB family protein [Candidatus Diapherotrites archaeon]|nr:MgtC/SapB family protein [Candidatus Diapherotrites archaeon]